MKRTEESDTEGLAATHPHQPRWNECGRQRWGYFDEEIKLRISYFLSQRLHGKNMDIGGGWYLYYPNSTVIDLSPVCLSQNPAREKLQYDLDELALGKHLPYEDHSFDSATLISTWQYLLHPQALVQELTRILRPGSEIYLINGQGGGLQECMVRPGRSQVIQEYFQGLGYDTLVENIPGFYSDTKEFQSVCVAVPTPSVFGGSISQVKDKAARLRQNALILENPSIFQECFIDWEIGNVTPLLAKLAQYPITRFAKDHLDRVEQFSQEYRTQRGSIPLIFSEHTLEPEILMMVPGQIDNHSYLYLMGKDKPEDNIHDPHKTLAQKYGLSLGHYIGYWDFDTVAGLLEYCRTPKPSLGSVSSYKDRDEPTLWKLATFVASFGLNTFTRSLQKEVDQALKVSTPGWEGKVQRRQAFAYRMATLANKQRRKIEELIEQKLKIETEGIETVGTGNLNFLPFLEPLRTFLRK